MSRPVRWKPVLITGDPAVETTAVGGPVKRTVRRLGVHAVYLASAVLGDDVISRRLRVSLLRRAGADLGRGVSMHGGSFVSWPAHLVVGEGSFVNRGCYLDLEGRLVLGRRVTVGHGSTFVTTHHDLGPREKRCGPLTASPITVGDGSWLGANVTVLPGVSIGRGVVVAAGAVVTHDVPDDVLVMGVPAEVKRSLVGDKGGDKMRTPHPELLDV